MTTGTLIDLIWGTRDGDVFQPATITLGTPVRMVLDAALELLRSNGYGDALPTEDVVA